jgi:hypothetical protein
MMFSRANFLKILSRKILHFVYAQSHFAISIPVNQAQLKLDFFFFLQFNKYKLRLVFLELRAVISARYNRFQNR